MKVILGLAFFTIVIVCGLLLILSPLFPKIGKLVYKLKKKVEESE